MNATPNKLLFNKEISFLKSTIIQNIITKINSKLNITNLKISRIQIVVISFFLFQLLLSSCSTGIKFSSIQPSYPYTNDNSTNQTKNNNSGNDLNSDYQLIGEASYYADKFVGRKTANGEIYNHNQFTAAHKTLPFGSKVRVFNTRNGKEVVVKINDRGPFVSGRVIDLSKSAASELGIISSGLTEVILEVID